MKFFGQLKELIEANASALLKKAKDPVIFAQHQLVQLSEALAALQDDASKINGQLKQAKRVLDETTAEAARLDGIVEAALDQNNDADAEVSQKRYDEYCANQLSSAQLIYDAALQNSKEITDAYNKLAQDMRKYQAKVQGIEAKAMTAKAMSTINNIGTSSKQSQGIMGELDKMDAEVSAKLDTAKAKSELQSGVYDEYSQLDAKYGTGSAVSASAALAARKAKRASAANSHEEHAE